MAGFSNARRGDFNMFKPIEVIIPKSAADLKRLDELDKGGHLASGKSYPTPEQLKSSDSNLPKLPNWSECFKKILSNHRRAIEWGLPETWVHAELYAELANKNEATGWTPLPTEIPYVTLFPVVPGRGINARPDGVVKWSDLCLHTTDYSSWCWMELKVRHVGDVERASKAAKQALDVFRKDVVALQGFRAEETAEKWRDPDESAFYYSKRLTKLAKQVHFGKHHFVAIFIQLGGDGDLDATVWAERAVEDEIAKWRKHRLLAIGDQNSFTEKRLPPPVRYTVNGHAILQYEWPL